METFLTCPTEVIPIPLLLTDILSVSGVPAPASLEFKASLEKSLNCFGKRVKDLEKFGICLS